MKDESLLASWINEHLRKFKVPRVVDLADELRDGVALCELCEILVGLRLRRVKDNTLVSWTTNIQTALTAFERAGVQINGVKAEDITNGNSQQTAKLVWALFDHFEKVNLKEELNVNSSGSYTNSNVHGRKKRVITKYTLLSWVRKCVRTYGVSVTDFDVSWRDGRALLALVHHHKPSLFNYRETVNRQTNRTNLSMALNIIEKEFAIPATLDPVDIDSDDPNDEPLTTYVANLYEILPDVDLNGSNCLSIADADGETNGIDDYSRTFSKSSSISNFTMPLSSVDLPTPDSPNQGQVVSQTEALSFLSFFGKWVDEQLADLVANGYHPINGNLMTIHNAQLRVKQRCEQVQRKHEDLVKCTSFRSLFATGSQQAYSEMLSRIQQNYTCLLHAYQRGARLIDSLYEFLRLANTEISWCSELHLQLLSSPSLIYRQRDSSTTSNSVRSTLRELLEASKIAVRSRELQFATAIESGEALLRAVATPEIAPVLNDEEPTQLVPPASPSASSNVFAAASKPIIKLLDATVEKLRMNWHELAVYCECLEAHEREANAHEQFLTEIGQFAAWMRHCRARLQILIDNSTRTRLQMPFTDQQEANYELIRCLQQLSAFQHENAIEEHEKMINSLSNIARNLNAQIVLTRNDAVKNGNGTTETLYACRTLCNIRHAHGQLGARTVLDMVLERSSATNWFVRNRDQRFEVTIPSLCLLPLPPNAEAIRKIDKLSEEFQQMRRYCLEQVQILQKLVNTQETFDPDADLITATESKRKRDESYRDSSEESKRKPDESELPPEPVNSNHQEEIQEEINLLEALRSCEKILRERVLSQIELNQSSLRESYKNHKSFEESLDGMRSDVQGVLQRERGDSLLDEDIERVKSIGGLWNKLWLQCKSYLNRLQAAEVVICKLDFLHSEIREIKRSISEHRDQVIQQTKAPKCKLKEFRTLRRTFKQMAVILHDVCEIDLSEHVDRLKSFTKAVYNLIDCDFDDSSSPTNAVVQRINETRASSSELSSEATRLHALLSNLVKTLKRVDRLKLRIEQTLTPIEEAVTAMTVTEATARAPIEELVALAPDLSTHNTETQRAIEVLQTLAKESCAADVEAEPLLPLAEALHQLNSRYWHVLDHLCRLGGVHDYDELLARLRRELSGVSNEAPADIPTLQAEPPVMKVQVTSSDEIAYSVTNTHMYIENDSSNLQKFPSVEIVDKQIVEPVSQIDRISPRYDVAFVFDSAQQRFIPVADALAGQIVNLDDSWYLDNVTNENIPLAKAVGLRKVILVGEDVPNQLEACRNKLNEGREWLANAERRLDAVAKQPVAREQIASLRNLKDSADKQRSRIDPILADPLYSSTLGDETKALSDDFQDFSARAEKQADSNEEYLRRVGQVAEKVRQLERDARALEKDHTGLRRVASEMPVAEAVAKLETLQTDVRCLEEQVGEQRGVADGVRTEFGTFDAQTDAKIDRVGDQCDALNKAVTRDLDEAMRRKENVDRLGADVGQLQDRALEHKASCEQACKAGLGEGVGPLQPLIAAVVDDKGRLKQVAGQVGKLPTGDRKLLAPTCEKTRKTLDKVEKDLGDCAAARKRAQEEAERAAKAEQERLQKQEEAERKAREEAERKAREEAEKKAREEAERKAKEEAERRAREKERRAKKEAERRAKEEALRKAREEEEAQRRAREEALKRAKEEEEAKRRAKEEAERKAKEEALRRAKEEEEALKRAKEEEKRAKEAERREALRLAKELGRKRAKEEMERQNRDLDAPAPEVKKDDQSNVRINPEVMSLAEIQVWLEDTEKALDQMQPVRGDFEGLQKHGARLRLLQTELAARQTLLDSLRNKPSVEAAELERLDSVFKRVSDKRETKASLVSRLCDEASAFKKSVADLDRVLDAAESKLATQFGHFVYVLPEAQEQYVQWDAFRTEFRARDPEFQKAFDRRTEIFNGHTDLPLCVASVETETRHASLCVRIAAVGAVIAENAEQAASVGEKASDLQNWISVTKAQKVPPSRVLPTIDDQLQQHSVLKEQLAAKKADVNELTAAAEALTGQPEQQASGPAVEFVQPRSAGNSVKVTLAAMAGAGDDPEALRDVLRKQSGPNAAKLHEQVRAIKAKFNRLSAAYDSQHKALNDSAKDVHRFFRDYEELSNWLDAQQNIDQQMPVTIYGQLSPTAVSVSEFNGNGAPDAGVASDHTQPLTIDTSRLTVPAHRGSLLSPKMSPRSVNLRASRDLQNQLQARQPALEQLKRAGRLLADTAPVAVEQQQLRGMLNDLSNRWGSVAGMIAEKCRKMDERAHASNNIGDMINSLSVWIAQADAKLKANPHTDGELKFLEKISNELRFVDGEYESKRPSLKDIQRMADDLLSERPDTMINDTSLSEKVTSLNKEWDNLKTTIDERAKQLEAGKERVRFFQKTIHALLQFHADAEKNMKDLSSLWVVRSAEPDGESLASQIAYWSSQEAELSNLENKLVGEVKMQIDNAHSRAEEILHGAPRESQPFFKQALGSVDGSHVAVSGMVSEKLKYVRDRLSRLRRAEDLLNGLLPWVIENLLMVGESNAKDLPIDNAQLTRMLEDNNLLTSNIRDRQGDVDVILAIDKKAKAKYDAMKNDSLGSPNAGSNNKKQPTPSSQKRANNGSLRPDAKARNPDIDKLAFDWPALVQHANEQRRRLEDALRNANQLAALANFDLDRWRDDFLDWLKKRKKRIADIFRENDRNNDGHLTIEEFVRGILNAGFDKTNEHELRRVASLVDANRDNLINHTEFKNLLYPPVERVPLTEAEQLESVVKQEIAKCDCSSFQFDRDKKGGGRIVDRDGRKRLLRILRSVVMVRVGGGWEKLDEFLDTHDPCRAKGRTNMEIREELHRPYGATDTVATFSPRRSRSNSVRRHGSSADSDTNEAGQSMTVIDRPPEFSDAVKQVASQLGIPTSTVSEVRQKTVPDRPWQSRTAKK